MLKKRKSQGLSITTIILAVIGLIILVALVALLTGRLGDFNRDLTEQKEAGKQAVSEVVGYETTTTESSLQPQLPSFDYM